MTIKMKQVKIPKSNMSLDEVINKGAKTKSENEKNQEVQFTIRMPRDMVELIDIQRKKHAGKISRNAWICNTLMEMLY